MLIRGCVAQIACIMHGEFTVEDVSQVGSLSDVLVSELLDVLSRSWKVGQRDYRNGLVYRYVALPVFASLPLDQSPYYQVFQHICVFLRL